MKTEPTEAEKIPIEHQLKCKRYLDCLPWETYSYSDFNEVDCEFFIENELKKEK